MPSDRTVKYVHSPDRTFEWFWYSFLYFQAAKTLAEAYRTRTFGADTLFPPLIYNLRHALELMLKFLTYNLGEIPANLSHHNVQTIFGGVKTAIASLDDESLTFAASGLGVKKELIAQALQAATLRVETLTGKYFSYTFLATPIEDKKNELFRYPVTTESGPFDISGCHTRLSADEILADTKELSDFLLFVVGAFAKNEKGLHIYDEINAQSAGTHGHAHHEGVGA